MVDSKITVDDFEEICRTCLCDCTNKASFQLHSFMIFEKVVLGDVLSNCASIKISKEDSLPKQLCQKCLVDLTNCHNFIDTCQKSQQTLLDILNKKENETNIEDPPLSNEPNDDWSLSDDEPIENKCEQKLVEVDNQNSTMKTETKKTPGSSVRKRNPPTKRNCDQCQITFASYKEYKDHRRNVKHPKTPLSTVCPVCDKQFATRRRLTTHLRNHTTERRFICEICSAVFKCRQNLKRHQMIHTGERPHVCHLCGAGFIQKTSLVEHLRKHTGESPSYICSVCGKGFKQPSALTKHSKIHEEGSEESLKKQRSEGQKRRSEDFQFECSTCHRKYATQQSLKTHEQLLHNEPRFLCNECGVRKRTKLSLQVHERLHTNEKPYKCNVCDKTFRQSTSLRLHTYVHTGEKRYKCSECGKCFKQPQHLRVHFKALHAREKPYKCSFCEKRFGVKCSMVVHERTHTGETPFVCHVCGRGFYDASARRKHLKNHMLENAKEKQAVSV